MSEELFRLDEITKFKIGDVVMPKYDIIKSSYDYIKISKAIKSGDYNCRFAISKVDYNYDGVFCTIISPTYGRHVIEESNLVPYLEFRQELLTIKLQEAISERDKIIEQIENLEIELENIKNGEVQEILVLAFELDGNIIQKSPTHFKPEYLPTDYVGKYVRFKTKEERLMEPGINKSDYRDGFNWNDNMDYLFGAYVCGKNQEVPSRTRNLLTPISSRGSWHISHYHLVVDEIKEEEVLS